MKNENELRQSHSKTSKKCGIKFHICYTLCIPAEKEPNSGIRERERLRQKRRRQIDLISDARMLSS
jgi:hypothetical protein